MSLSSDPSMSPTEEEEDLSDGLGGSQSRRWFADIVAGINISDHYSNDNTIVSDGLFVDRHFPVGQTELMPTIRWKRPKEICRSPQFIVDGASRMDMQQGGLSDCWFLSAVASLTLHRSMLEKVVPLGQSFDKGYDGSFCFQFWQYGEWVEVRVDDLLPTLNGELIYLSSPQNNEFWSSLLEKAYARLKGGYCALNMGFPHEAMVDMTGGVTEVLNISSLPRELPVFLNHLLAKGALINCANCQGPLEKANEMGIVYRHAYSVTALEKVKTNYGTVVLVRINNPWGKTEWVGPWSDLNGPEWNTVSNEEQMRLQRVIKDDGEFWMSIPDFRQSFETMEICHLSDSLGPPGFSTRPWHCIMLHGSWVPTFSAGGPPRDGWFWQNPQFNFSLSKADEDQSDGKKTCSFLVALMQKHQRRRGSNLSIGLHIYMAHAEKKYLSALDLNLLHPVLSSLGYTPRREAVLRGDLLPGHYVIIPSTLHPNQEGEFILRILTEKGSAVVRAEQPGSTDVPMVTQPSFPHSAALPSPKHVRRLFKKHCNKRGSCRPLELLNLLTEAIQGGVLGGSEKTLSLEHCKSFVVLMDTNGLAQLDWHGFQSLWDRLTKWTDIFLKFDKNKSKHLEYPEVPFALEAAGMTVDEFVMQLIGLRYTEPNMTVSYPGFLYLMMKLDSMIRKFQAFDMVGGGTISINYRQWLHMTMYN